MKTKSGEAELASLGEERCGRRATKNTELQAKKLRRKMRKSVVAERAGSKVQLD